jgi:hypothetical protein
MISEYSLNSMLLTAVDLDVIKFENSDQNSESIDAILSDFETTYGVFPNVTIVAEASTFNLQRYKPNIKINKQGSLIEFYIDLHIKNPIEPSIDAALFVTKAILNISFTVTDNFMLYGTINDLSLAVVDYRPYFKSSTTRENINSKISFLLPAMEAFANNKLDNGYKIPMPDNVAKYIKN